MRNTLKPLSYGILLCAFFLPVGCGNGSGGDDVLGSDVPGTDEVTPADISPDQTTDVPIEDTSDTGGDVSDTQVPEDTGPQIIYSWSEIPLGASGDLHRIRFLPGVGFRIVGAGGTVLRPLKEGWIREWTPSAAGSINDVTVHEDILYAVGESGLWLRHSSGGTWSALESGVNVDLNGAASVKSGVLAVGDNGVIVHFEDGQFGQELSGVSTNLNAVASSDEDTAYAVGDVGVAVRRVASPVPCEDETGVLCGACTVNDDCTTGLCETISGDMVCTRACGLESDDCPAGFLCTDPEGNDGFCLPEPEHNWLGFQAASAAVRLDDMFALDSNNIWAVGSNGSITRYNGGQWKLELSNDIQKRDVHGVSGGAGQIVATGAQGLFLNYDQDDWSLESNIQGPLLTTRTYRSVAVGSSKIVTVGDGGAMQSKIIPNQPYVDDFPRPEGAVHDMAFEGDYGIAVGDDGLMTYWNEDGYGAVASGTEVDLHGAFVAEDGTVFAVGESGTLLRRQPGGEVQNIETTTNVDLFAVHQLEDGQILCLGASGTIVRVAADLTSVTPETTPDPRKILDVFETNDGLIAVGGGGAILRRNGEAWESVPSGTTVDLFAGSYANGRAVVVGAHGMILVWADGESPERVGEDPGTYYYGVHVEADGQAVIVGWAGAYLSLSLSNNLSEPEAPAGTTFRSVAQRNGKVWLAGDAGGLWQRDETIVSPEE